MNSVRHFWDAVQVFFDKLSAVDLGAMFVALFFHQVNLILRSQAWRRILKSAFPHSKVEWPHVFGGYMAGAGVNGILPARGGDVTKLFLVHSRIRDANYPTLTATLIVETLFDIPMSFLLAVWAYLAGRLPSLPSIPGLSGFEWSFIAAHSTESVVVLGVLAFAAAAFLIVRGKHIRAFWNRVAAGFAILRTPERYLREVVALQAAGWVCRVFTAWFFLIAFNVPANLENALVVMVVQGAATAMPLTPGGIGPKQALAVVLLAGVAARSDILAFSVGMDLGLIAFNLLVGLTCMAVMLRGLNFRRAIALGREQQAAAAQDARERNG